MLFKRLGVDFSFFSFFRMFKNVLQLMKDAFFKHGDKEALRSCMKAINFCSAASQVGLLDFARSKLKEVEDEIVAKVKSAIEEVEGCTFLSYLQ